MRFQDPKVQAVFEEYCRREAEDRERMRALGPEGFARRDEFLLPVGEETGWLLHALVVARKPRRILELGTSYGYSTLFLADAARQVGASLVSMDVAGYKQDYARERLELAGLSEVVELRCGDAVQMVAEDRGEWDFALLDIWKDLYVPCFEALYPALAEEGVVCTDNMVFPPDARENARDLRKAISAKPDMQTVLLPIGQGLELSVRLGAGSDKL